MPQDDLTTLSGPELRQMLDSARRSGQADQSYRILQEMAARREGRARKKPAPKVSRRRSADEPRVLAFNLDDPAEARDAPAAAAPAAGTVTIPPGAIWHSLDDRDPDPDSGGDFGHAHVNGERDPDPPPLEGPIMERERARAPRLTRGGLAAGFAVGVAVGAGLGWWAAGGARMTASPAPVAAAFRTAAASEPAPVTPPAAVPDPVAPTASEPAAQPAPQADAGGGRDAAAESADTAHEPAPINALPQAAPAPATAPAPEPATPSAPLPATSPAANAGADGCASQPTPADRAICADPRLRRLQRDLRKAYAEALDAHADRALLREHQLAWADARDGVADPDRLAALYAQRIRKLNAATADARRQK